jgi:hypothetical protein
MTGWGGEGGGGGGGGSRDMQARKGCAARRAEREPYLSHTFQRGRIFIREEPFHGTRVNEEGWTDS